MASTVIRRPLPALIALVALLLLTGIVWWRVLHRNDSSPNANACTTASPARSVGPVSPNALPAAASITVQVLNSTKRNGIATAVRATLVKDGFRVPAPADNDRSTTKAKNTGVAQLRFGPTGRRAAAHLRYYLPGSTLVATTSPTAVVVVALGTKYKALATPTAVAAAMKAASVVVATPRPTPTTPASTCASGT